MVGAVDFPDDPCAEDEGEEHGGVAECAGEEADGFVMVEEAELVEEVVPVVNEHLSV